MDKNQEDEFEGVWIDINGFTAKEWKEIQTLAMELKSSGTFKGDPFKCTIGAFVLWVSEGNGLLNSDLAEDGDWLH